jgi:chromosome partitioning related protein ParA
MGGLRMIISIVSTKGGVGKTTLSANLAGYLSSIGKSVLMIDADPQPSLSSYYQIPNLKPGGITEVLKNPTSVNDYINQTLFGDLIVSNDSNNLLQNYLLSEADGRFRLKFAIKELDKKYDFIIIDTQGAKGALQDASVLAADKLLSPILPELATIKEFNRGTLSMLKSLEAYKSMGIHIPELFGIIYKLDNTKDANQFSNHLLSNDNNDYSMLEAIIPQAVIFKEAITQQVPITEFSNGNKKQKQKADKSIKSIIELCKELELC